MQVSLNITSVDSSQNKKSKSLTYINPNATNAQLQTAAQKFNAISSNTYVDAEKISRQSVSEPDPTSKTEPTLTVDSTGAITYNGDGQLFINSSGTDAHLIFLHIYENQISAKNAAGNTPQNYSCTIYSSEGTNYTAKSVEFTYGGQ